MLLSIKERLFSLSYRIQFLILRLWGNMVPKEENILSFIPHGGMFTNGYDIFNYKSDNTLALLHYIIEHYGNKYKYRLACDKRQHASLSSKLKENYSYIDIKCFPYFGLSTSEFLSVSRFRYLMVSSIIFCSEAYPLPFKNAKQKGVLLGYYKPFKNDYDMHQVTRKDKYDRYYDVCLSSSLIASYIMSQCYNIKLDKYVTLGYSRDDELLNVESCPQLENDITENTGWKPNKVFLFTPTHRDYEKASNKSRGVLGFDFDKARMEKFLCDNHALIICKIHNAQNIKAISETVPKGILFYHASKEYGLCELMWYSDCLITDYTSAYLDYLLLDRPVLFNFYDYNIYEKSRGFSYDPLKPILAGEIITDEESFYEKMQMIIDGVDNFKEKRKFVRDLTHKYLDTYSSKRICEYIFGDN